MAIGEEEADVAPPRAKRRSLLGDTSPLLPATFSLFQHSHMHINILESTCDNHIDDQKEANEDPTPRSPPCASSTSPNLETTSYSSIHPSHTAFQPTHSRRMMDSSLNAHDNSFAPLPLSSQTQSAQLQLETTIEVQRVRYSLERINLRAASEIPRSNDDDDI